MFTRLSTPCPHNRKLVCLFSEGPRIWIDFKKKSSFLDWNMLDVPKQQYLDSLKTKNGIGWNSPSLLWDRSVEFYLSNSLISEANDFPRLAAENSPLKSCRAQFKDSVLSSCPAQVVHQRDAWGLDIKRKLSQESRHQRAKSLAHSSHEGRKGPQQKYEITPILVILGYRGNQPHKELYDVLQRPGQEMWVDIYFNQTWNDPAIFPWALSVS